MLPLLLYALVVLRCPRRVAFGIYALVARRGSSRVAFVLCLGGTEVF